MDAAASESWHITILIFSDDVTGKTHLLMQDLKTNVYCKNHIYKYADPYYQKSSVCMTTSYEGQHEYIKRMYSNINAYENICITTCHNR